MDGLTNVTPYVPFPKIARLSRDVVVTEKIDGTNALIAIRPVSEPLDGVPVTASTDEFCIYAGSRTRWISPGEDNYGFAAWVFGNAEDLAQLGAGNHFGEWWGRGIQRNYSQTERYFSLFNTGRWGTHFDHQGRVGPCRVVPTLYAGPLEEHGVMKGVKAALHALQTNGSVAAPGFMKPEGIVLFHTQSQSIFKKTFDKDDAGKDRGRLIAGKP